MTTLWPILSCLSQVKLGLRLGNPTQRAKSSSYGEKKVKCPQIKPPLENATFMWLIMFAALRCGCFHAPTGGFTELSGEQSGTLPLKPK